jgi:hypothetical protein
MICGSDEGCTMIGKVDGERAYPPSLLDGDRPVRHRRHGRRVEPTGSVAFTFLLNPPAVSLRKAILTVAILFIAVRGHSGSASEGRSSSYLGTGRVLVPSP